jgi:hypothetical protein
MKNAIQVKGIIVLIFFLVCFLSHSNTVNKTEFANDTLSSDSLQQLKPAVQKDTTPQAKPMVTKVVSLSRLRGKNMVRFGDLISIKVKNIDVLFKQQDSCNAKAKSDTLCPIVLFINGVVAEDIKAYSINKDSSSITFKLDRNSASIKNIHFEYLWSSVLVNFSVGLKDSEPAPIDPNMPKIYFKYVTNLSIYIIILMVLGTIAIFAYLVRETDLIRITTKKSKYSLGLAQLLFWVFLIAIAFIYIWITTTEMYPITGSVLVLLTISLSTSGGARLVDKARDPNRIFEPSGGHFFKDIVSDDAGYSVHRVQMVIWTVILGIIFIHEVVVEQQMPQFDSNLLLLMGISSTGYVGLKSIETIQSEKEKAEAALKIETEKKAQTASKTEETKEDKGKGGA